MIRKFCVALFSGAYLTTAFASEPPKPVEAPKPKPARPAGLTGNTVPKCEAGTYAAGNICKPSPPGFYVPSGATYPLACPAGKSSPAGSRSPGECA